MWHALIYVACALPHEMFWNMMLNAVNVQ